MIIDSPTRTRSLSDVHQSKVEIQTGRPADQQPRDLLGHESGTSRSSTASPTSPSCSYSSSESASLTRTTIRTIAVDLSWRRSIPTNLSIKAVNVNSKGQIGHEQTLRTNKIQDQLQYRKEQSEYRAGSGELEECAGLARLKQIFCDVKPEPLERCLHVVPTLGSDLHTEPQPPTLSDEHPSISLGGIVCMLKRL